MYTHKFGGSEEEKTNKQNKVLSNKKLHDSRRRGSEDKMFELQMEWRDMRTYPIEKLEKRNN